MAANRGHEQNTTVRSKAVWTEPYYGWSRWLVRFATSCKAQEPWLTEWSNHEGYKTVIWERFEEASFQCRGMHLDRAIFRNGILTNCKEFVRRWSMKIAMISWKKFKHTTVQDSEKFGSTDQIVSEDLQSESRESQIHHRAEDTILCLACFTLHNTVHQMQTFWVLQTFRQRLVQKFILTKYGVVQKFLMPEMFA